jgi:hypothetical protein
MTSFADFVYHREFLERDALNPLFDGHVFLKQERRCCA